jgi:hypothetical protein
MKLLQWVHQRPHAPLLEHIQWKCCEVLSYEAFCLFQLSAVELSWQLRLFTALEFLNVV